MFLSPYFHGVKFRADYPTKGHKSTPTNVVYISRLRVPLPCLDEAHVPPRKS